MSRLGRPSRIAVVGAVLAGASLIVLAGCAPLPDAEPTTAGSATSTSTAAPAASDSATPTPTTEPGFAVPADCRDIYSADMLAALDSANPPLNDPTLTMYSTENVTGLELLSSGVTSLRCTWGVGGSAGLATNVTAITAGDADELVASFESSGMSCAEYTGGQICRIEHETIDRSDNLVDTGETHYVGRGGWISTRWVNFAPEGYTEDIVATLWP
ncbi:hypothetical protein GCM10009808_12710 [Microbacterium sediminicola]|uniref:Uncharacterized protein n=1 Tax=Microbacterium sediminicola TaxID=415210 RepID=A0ABN2I0U2_9MICO